MSTGLTARLEDVLKKLTKLDEYDFFVEPVDVTLVRPPTALHFSSLRPWSVLRPLPARFTFCRAPLLAQVPDYPTLVANPMDFRTMRQRLAAGMYLSFDAFAADFVLIATNAMAYNPEETIFYKQAANMLERGRALLEKAKAKWTGACVHAG